MKVKVIPIMIGTVTNAFGTVTEELIKGLKNLEIRGGVETDLIYNNTRNKKNTEKNPGDLRRLAITQTSQRPTANAVVKNSQRENLLAQ